MPRGSETPRIVGTLSGITEINPEDQLNQSSCRQQKRVPSEYKARV